MSASRSPSSSPTTAIVAEDAAALVAVDYEPLPAVADCRAALAPDAPRAHRDAPHNLAAEFDMGYGDVERAFAAAPHVFRESLLAASRRQPFDRMPRHRRLIRCDRGPAHPVDLDADAACGACGSSATSLGRDENRLRVVTPDVGGGFGPKLVFYPEDVAVARRRA